MILEQIRDFNSEPYDLMIARIEALSHDELLDTACSLEKRAVDFYKKAADKLNKHPETSRMLKLLAKKRARNLTGFTQLR